MNERIKELAKQVTRQYSPTYYTEEWASQFAKLVILECADFVAAGEFGDPGAARELKKYFGVEE